MKELRNINRALAYIPVISAGSYGIMVLYGFFTFGELPNYRLHTNMETLGLLDLATVGLLAELASFFTLPACVLMTIHLALNRIPFRKSDWISLSLMVLSLAFYLYLIYINPNLFSWLSD